MCGQRRMHPHMSCSFAFSSLGWMVLKTVGFCRQDWIHIIGMVGTVIDIFTRWIDLDII